MAEQGLEKYRTNCVVYLIHTRQSILLREPEWYGIISGMATLAVLVYNILTYNHIFKNTFQCSIEVKGYKFCFFFIAAIAHRGNLSTNPASLTWKEVWGILLNKTTDSNKTMTEDQMLTIPKRKKNEYLSKRNLYCEEK